MLRTLSLTAVLPIVALLILSAPRTASADCVASSGDVDNIIETGVDVSCDSNEPNPYLGGIGTTATSTDVSVSIETGSEVVSTGIGVALENGGSLDNDGTLRANDTAVSAIDSNGGSGITISNSGTIRSTEGAGVIATLNDNTITNSGEIISDDIAVSLGSDSELTNSGSITSGSTLAVSTSGNSTIDNTGTINGDGDVAISLQGGGNRLELGTGSEIDGDVIATPGGAASDLLVLSGAGSEAENYTGFASLLMQGESWTFNGAVQADTVTVESGTLTLNGSVTTSSVDISAGTLAGVGVINGSVNNTAGTVSAGDPAGQLTITGDYIQASGASLRVASSNTNVGVLQVNGSAELAGNLVISAGPDLIADLLIADGGITGSFDTISVDGRALVAVVPTANTISMVRVSTTLEDNMVEAGLDNSYLMLDGLASGIHTRPGSGIWLKALGTYGERDETDGLPGGDYTIGGGGIGGDWQLGENFRIGGLFAYTSTDLDSDDGGDGSADNYNYGVFANYDRDTSWGGIWATLAAAAGSSDVDQTRRILVNNTADKVSADYDADSYALRGILGTRHAFLGNMADTWVFEPSVSVDYVVMDLDDYSEDSGAGLTYSIDDIESLQLALQLRTRRLLQDNKRLAPRFQLSVIRRIAIDDREWNASGGTGGNTLVLPGDDDDVTSLGAAAGFEYRLNSRIYGYADWLGEFSEDKRRHSLVLGLRINLGS
jgi:hypothetical protein